MPLTTNTSASSGFVYSFWWGVAATLCALLLFCLAGACVRRCGRAPGQKPEAPRPHTGEVSWLLPAGGVGETLPPATTQKPPKSGAAKAASSGSAAALPSATQGGKAAASGMQSTLTISAAPTHITHADGVADSVPQAHQLRSYGTATRFSAAIKLPGEAAVPSAAQRPPPSQTSLRCPSLKSDIATADELEDEYAGAVAAMLPWRVPSPAAPMVPAATSARLNPSESLCAPGPLSSSQTRHIEVTLPAAEAPQATQELVSLNTPEQPLRQASSTTSPVSAKTSGTPPAIAPARRSLFCDSDGGEAATVVHDLEACLHATRAEVERVQWELQATLESTERAREEQDRLAQGIADMEQYRSSLDGIIAFTLRELEDAAAGVEEAEEKVRRESAAAQRCFDAIQSRLLSGS